MPRDLQFAFLGCHNSYLASVTWVNQSGCPHEPPTIAHHGLPRSFVENYDSFAANKYVYNVRGHDCFSFMGTWTRGNSNHPTSATSHLINEIDGVRTLSEQNKRSKPPYKEEDLLLSLGPGPGSFFADAFRLKRYKWHNLPSDLEDEIQRELGRKKYGTIYDVALNSAGGWILQLKEGKKYRWGGTLPREIEAALEAGQARKSSIKHLYLNHQNKDDYVLIFTDSYAHVGLHKEFEQPLRRLIEMIFNKPDKLQWYFTASCRCNEYLQRQANAIFYNHRGRYHFQRQNFDQALMYMREACNLDKLNIDFFEDYCMALHAIRKRDHTPEEHYMLGFDAGNSLRNEYVLMRTRVRDIHMLEDRMREVLMQGHQRRPRTGWAYHEFTPSVAELSSTNNEYEGVYELESQQSATTSETESSRSRQGSGRGVLDWW